MYKNKEETEISLEVEIMKRCLVTGGKGFIGSHLVNFLKSKGHYVVNVDIVKHSFLPTKEDVFKRLDLRKPLDAFRSIVNGVDWVFNLAANMGGIGYITEFNAPIMRDNVRINLNMLDACRKYDVDRIFFSSSACIYPRFLQEIPYAQPLKECDDIPSHPDSAYGWEKLFSELLYRSYNHDYGLGVRIARFQNVFGSFCSFNDGREKYPAAICRKVVEAKDGDEIEVWGDGLQRRCYTYIDDCLDAVYLLMQSDFSDPLNIASDVFIGVNELAELVFRIAGKDLRIVNDVSKPQGVRGRRADLTLIRKVLGWDAKMDFKEGMTLLYHWVKSQMEA